MPSAAKSIAGSLRDTKELCCGLRQKSDAAALLHNAGYGIVDRNNKPVAPPESGDHLIPQADRLSLCARNYYVDPAREAGVAAGSIRAGTDRKSGVKGKCVPRRVELVGRRIIKKRQRNIQMV